MAPKSGNGRAKAAALEQALRSMFGKLQSRATPEQLVALADDLDAADFPLKKAARR